MFGREVNRYCPKCKVVKEIEVSVSYMVNSKSYYDVMYCPACKLDLATEDREIIKEARTSGEIDGVEMF